MSAAETSARTAEDLASKANVEAAEELRDTKEALRNVEVNTRVHVGRYKRRP